MMKNLFLLKAVPATTLLGALSLGSVHAALAQKVVQDPAMAEVNPFTGVPVGQDLLAKREVAAVADTKALSPSEKPASSQPTKAVATTPVVEAKPKASTAPMPTPSPEVKDKGGSAVAAVAKRPVALRKPKAVPVKPVSTPVVEAPTPAPAPVPVCQPQLLSVISVGQTRSVVLDMNGSILTWQDGSYTPCGRVTVKDLHTANVGALTYKVNLR